MSDTYHDTMPDGYKYLDCSDEVGDDAVWVTDHERSTARQRVFLAAAPKTYNLSLTPQEANLLVTLLGAVEIADNGNSTRINPDVLFRKIQNLSRDVHTLHMTDRDGGALCYGVKVYKY